MYMSPNSLSKNEIRNRIHKLLKFNTSIENLKSDIRKANNKLEKTTNKSSNTYKNGLKLRDKLKNKLKEQNNMRKEYLNIVCSENMANEINNLARFGEKVARCPSNFPQLDPNKQRVLNRVLKKTAIDVKNALKKQNVHAARRMNSKRASTSGRR